ncbi:PRC-barrel domain-containing protein [Thioclava sp. GXIMD4215]|uniref:PRC-barrel domain-containing protein n=1 Tax=Thioclava sp. GXIMD4215 TaxID=3131928 RepID=UPI00324956D3
MKKLLATTAITVMAALPVMAQSNATAGTDMAPKASGGQASAGKASAGASAETAGKTFFASVPDAVMASDFIGKRVYATAEKTTDITAQSDMDDIGEVSDVVIGMRGDVEAVLIDVGGFLGIGEKTVAVNLDALQIVPNGDNADEYRLVMQGDKGALETAPAYDPAMDRMDHAAATTGSSMKAAGNDVADAAHSAAGWTKDKAAAAGAAVSGAASEAADWTKDKTAQAGSAMEKAGDDMSQAADHTKADMKSAADTPANPDGTPITDWTQITAQDLNGQPVYGPNDETIGKVSDVVTDAGQGVTKVIVNVGGFLGLGAKSVALTPDQMEVTKGEKGLSIHVAATQDELEQMPEYTG